jgi:hypothetical protein
MESTKENGEFSRMALSVYMALPVMQMGAFALQSTTA